MSGWKRCLLMSVLASTVACGDSEDDGVSEGDASNIHLSDDGGVHGDGGVARGDASVSGGDASVSGRKDGGPSSVGDGDAGDECSGLKARIRDFNPATHPDFEKFSGSGATTGLLQTTLGTDNKPVFAASKGQITSADSFSSWYNDMPGTNIGIDIEIPLTEMPNMANSFEFSDSTFFPIDAKGFASGETPVEPMKNGHNFNFTTEVHTKFTYRRGDNFMFQGDDDLWIFVNGKLALDLGGLHSSLPGTIDFDSKAAELGITVGGTYNMDIFHAERHTTESNFRIRTNIDCFKTVFVQ
jgi:fibro-slime domain-containing protein